jgi:hypothetical protein
MFTLSAAGFTEASRPAARAFICLNVIWVPAGGRYFSYYINCLRLRAMQSRNSPVFVFSCLGMNGPMTVKR